MGARAASAYLTFAARWEKRLSLFSTGVSVSTQHGVSALYGGGERRTNVNSTGRGGGDGHDRFPGVGRLETSVYAISNFCYNLYIKPHLSHRTFLPYLLFSRMPRAVWRVRCPLP